MILVTLKLTLCSLNEGTGHPMNLDMLMEKKIFPQYAGTMQDVFTMRAKVDADNTSDTVTRRSRTGFLVYLKCASVYWWSKKQMSVEYSSLGAEFIAEAIL